MKNPIDIKERIKELKFDCDLYQRVAVSKEEEKEFTKLKKNNQSLPTGVICICQPNEAYYEFYRVYKADVELSNDELNVYISLQQIHYLKLIEKYLRYFYNLAIFSVIVGIIAGLISILIKMAQ